MVKWTLLVKKLINSAKSWLNILYCFILLQICGSGVQRKSKELYHYLQSSTLQHFLHSTRALRHGIPATRQVFVNLFSPSTASTSLPHTQDFNIAFCIPDVHSWHRTLHSSGGTWAYHLCVTMTVINIHRTIWSLSFRAGILTSCQLIVWLLTLSSITTITRHCLFKTMRVRILHDRNIMYLSSHHLSVFINSH